MNWVDLAYDREYRAVNNKLTFRRDSELSIMNQYQISGFTSSDITIVKADLTRLTDFLIIPSDDNYTVIFQDYTGSDRPKYRLFTGDQIENVQRIVPEEPLIPLLASISTDYLILAPDSFRTTLQPLADFHGARIIDIDDVYREYSGGQIDPRAIKTFLKDVWSRGVPGLRYVLIATMQGKWFGWEGNNGAHQAFIPAMKIQTYGFGAVASDTWYTLVSGDDSFPDFAIGRFPARNREELAIMVTKTMQSLTRNDLAGDNRLLMIGGYETTFKDQSETLIDPILEQGYFPKRLYIDRYSEGGPFFGNTDTLISALNRGLWYINFLGHGGGAVWGDRSLLTLDDLSRLTNAHPLPLVTSMTCFTGDVTNPDALGRRMMSLPTGGASAWLGSAGVGWIINDFLLLEPIHRHLFSDENWTLGELINQGKIEDLATNLGFPDIAKTQLYQFNLTGDPALPIRRPQNVAITASPPVVSGGDQIIVSGITPTADSLVVCLYDQDNLPRGQFQSPTITLPQSTPTGWIRINADWKEGAYLRHGSAVAGVEGALVRVVDIHPSSPSELDSIQIIVEAADPMGLDSVFARINGNRFPLPVRIASDRYSLESPLSPFPAGATVFIEPGVINAIHQEIWGPSLTLTIQPAIAPQVTDLTFFADDELGLQ
ncbi:MAG: hypothetical protein GXO90_05645, partial [FCB group bacterium]|nr:hypothetical protein [FCB group bacterium]